MLFFPGAEFVHVGGASHGGRMFTENLRGHLRFLAKHRGPAEAERARRLLLAALRLRGVLFPGERGPDVPRRRGLARVGLGAVAALGTARVSRRFHFERLPRELAALPALALARVLPDSGFGLYLKLAAATLVVLLPGALIARAARPAERVGDASPGALTGIFGAGAIVFAVHGSLDLALGLYAALGAAALVVAALRRERSPRAARPAGRDPARRRLRASLLWHVAGTLDGDALFHLARVRKLLAFADLHLRTLDEFKDGGLHPGYAFPLWHLFLAFVARLSGRRRGPRGAARGEHPLPARVRGRLRVGHRGLPEPRRPRSRRCSRRSRCSRSAGGHGGSLRPPRAAGDDGAAAARARW